TVAPLRFRRIKDCAREHRLTINTLLQGAYAWLLSGYVDSFDVVFGTTVSGRPAELPGIESMVGLFINTVPARVRIDPQAPVGTFLQRLQATNNERRAFEHASLVDIQKSINTSSGGPMFDTLLAVESFPASQHFSLPEIHLVQSTNYKLSIVAEPAEKLRFRALFDSDAISHEHVERLLHRYAAILEQMVMKFDDPLCEVEFIYQAEQDQLKAINQTSIQPLPQDGRIDDGFRRVAQSNPSRRAVFDGTTTMTYAELDEKSDRVASFLRKAGAQPSASVAMLFEPCVDAVVALVGITKAGCAYAPIDPTLPLGRISQMLEDLKPVVTLTHRGLQKNIGASPTIH
ncbi:MAG: condensation domain-containing protein, partial [Myxococcota bacterium]